MMFGEIRKFLRRCRAEQLAVIEAATICGVAKVLLVTMPYSIVDALSEKATGGGRDRWLESNPEEIEHLIRAVNTAGEFVPGGKNCLVRAVSAKVILARRGYPTHIRFGVEKQQGGTLGAHAWLEGGGRVLIGAFEVGRYLPLVRARKTG